MNLRAKILNAKDLKTEVVHVTEWDADVMVQSMTSGERGEVLEAVRDASGAIRLGKLTVLTVIKCAKDPETKQRLFEDTDYDVLASKNAAAVEKVAAVALRLSGLGDEAQKELEKNSAGVSGTPTSDSPAN